MTLMCSLTQYFQIKSFRFSLIKTSEKNYYKKVPFSASKINFLENFRNFKSTNLVFFSNNNITNSSNRHGKSVVKLWLKMVKIRKMWQKSNKMFNETIHMKKSFIAVEVLESLKTSFFEKIQISIKKCSLFTIYRQVEPKLTKFDPKMTKNRSSLLI